MRFTFDLAPGILLTHETCDQGTFPKHWGCNVACIQRCRDRYHRHTLYGEPHSSQLVGELRCLGPRVLKEALFHLDFVL